MSDGRDKHNADPAAIGATAAARAGGVPPEGANRGIQGSIEAAAVAQLFRQIPNAVAANLVLLLFVAAALAGSVPPWILWLWASAVVASNALRLGCWASYRRASGPDPTSWRRRAVAMLGLSGLLWGLTIPLFALQVAPMTQAVLIIALAGVTAGGLPANAVIMSAYLILVIAALAPAMATYLLYVAVSQGQGPFVVLGLMPLFYGAAMSVAARTQNRDQRGAYEVAARLDAANRELERRATYDAVTGLLNRASIERALDDEINRQARYGDTFSLIMMDIDGFKALNDTYGHETGDRVLARLGEIFQEELRDADKPGRWGGEEFLVILPNTQSEAAIRLAERLRQRVAGEHFEDIEALTLSLGVSCGHQSGEDRPALLKRLDDALYGAKRSGRNRTRMAA